MPSAPQSDLNTTQIIHHCNRAAKTYDRVAILQQEIGKRMLQRLELIKLQPSTILDLGCGTGFFTPHLKKRFPKAHIIQFDIAINMLAVAKKNQGWFTKSSLICGAAEKLPIADQAIDLVFSNQMFCYSPQLEKVLSETKRILKPGGLLMFSTLGPDTLSELRYCWQQLDEYTHVHSFIDMHDIGDMLLHTRLIDPVMDIEYFTLTYPQAKILLEELKANGASNASKQQSPTLTGKVKLASCLEHYERFRDSEHRLPATFEVVYGHAWQPAIINTPGEVAISINTIKRRR